MIPSRWMDGEEFAIFGHAACEEDIPYFVEENRLSITNKWKTV